MNHHAPPYDWQGYASPSAHPTVTPTDPTHATSGDGGDRYPGYPNQIFSISSPYGAAAERQQASRAQSANNSGAEQLAFPACEM
jgi:hypothetical protein